MTALEIKIAQLNELIIKGETIRAIELFYADSVVVHENEDEPRIGKLACIANEKQNRERTKEFSSQLLNQAVDALRNVVFSEWEINFTSANGEKWRLTEVAVQHWHNLQIIREKFYYKAAYPIK